jgi:hypothetical protein
MAHLWSQPAVVVPDNYVTPSFPSLYNPKAESTLGDTGHFLYQAYSEFHFYRSCITAQITLFNFYRGTVSIEVYKTASARDHGIFHFQT